MMLSELQMLTATLAEAHRQMKIGQTMDIAVSKNDLRHLLRALDLYGAVIRCTKE